ncbi:MAG: DUF1049 domain-containing protein [Proteobacteria bacterium]|nr:DUF1049 domain-containing protein [Pseudomonadota bacterium]MDE3207949.1 LapA family protein [Pseudomonadota bacterium]
MRKIIITIFLVFTLVFILQNNQTIPITFISWVFPLSLALIIGAVLLIGIGIGGFLFLPSVVRQRLKLSQHHREIMTLKQKVEDQGLSVPSSPNPSNRQDKDNGSV